MITTLNNNAINTLEDKPIDSLTEQLNQFFIEHEKKAYSIALMSLKNSDDAMDVVQDVMIKFVEKYQRKNKKHWCGLFYRMIQNRVTDFHRANTQKKKYFGVFGQDEDNNLLEQVADESCVSAMDEIENHIKIEQLQACLQQLPTRQLQAFVCRIWEGLSVIQTAKSMKCSQGSVKTHLFRALNSIREQMGEQNPMTKGEENE